MLPDTPTKHRRFALLILIITTTLATLTLMVSFVSACCQHIGDYGPYGRLGLWGTVFIAGLEEAVSEAVIKIERNGEFVRTCTYLGRSGESPCANRLGLADNHDVESFPYYGVGICGLVQDIVDENCILSEPATLSVTVTYTDSVTGVSYQTHETVTIEAHEFNRWAERRLDVTLQFGSGSYEGQPSDWELGPNANLCNDILTLDECINRSPATISHNVSEQDELGLIIEQRQARFPNATTIYVDKDATGANTGATWTDAFTDLQPALAVAQYGDEIWVADGVYLPGTLLTDSFHLVPGVAIIGGFNGTESSASERNLNNLPTLSCDILGNDNGNIHPDEPTRADNCYTVVTSGAEITNTETSLSGFRISGGNAVNGQIGAGIHNSGNPNTGDLRIEANSADSNGGAAYVTVGGSPLIRFAQITNNHTIGVGGGIYIAESSPYIANSDVFSNTANHGAGIYIASGSLTMDRSSITNNSATSNGGGVYINSNVSLAFDTVDIVGNYASIDGGGLFNLGSFAYQNGIMAQNSAGQQGGGLFSSGGVITVTHASIAANSSQEGGGVAIRGATPSIQFTAISILSNFASQNGAGLYIDTTSTDPSLSFVNIAIRNNQAVENGGGLYTTAPLMFANTLISGNAANTGGGIHTADDLTLNNVTITGNWANSSGGGISVEAGNSTIQNSILWGNNDSSGGLTAQIFLDGGMTNVTYTLVEGSWVGLGNIDADPQFLTPISATDAPTLGGVFQLTLDSPAIDAGNNAIVVSDSHDIDNDDDTTELLPVDIEQQPRFLEHAQTDTGVGTTPIIDMGIYESRVSLAKTTKPEMNEANVSPCPAIEITPTEAITPALIATNTFNLSSDYYGGVPFDITMAEDTVVLNPQLCLPAGDRIEVGFTNTFAEPLNFATQSSIWNFVTGVWGGTAQFTQTQILSHDGLSSSVVLADIDGDGDLDAAISNWGESSYGIELRLNDGSGNFTENGQSIITGGRNRGFAFGDLDGDGDLDLWVGNSNENRPDMVWFNDGAGNFTDSGQALGDWHAHEVALADLDGDGDLDAFVANSNWAPNKVYLNDGTGFFTDSGQELDSEWSSSVSLGDIDGDGDLDAFATIGTQGSASHRIWLNNGSGYFVKSGQNIGGGNAHDGTMGDLDNDGDLDLIVVNYPEPDTIWFNNGSGYFVQSDQTLGEAEAGEGVALGDLNNDGYLDIYIARRLSDQIWLNLGDGTFVATPSAPYMPNNVGVALGDIDNDGDLDAILADQSTAGSEVWLNGEQAERIIGIATTRPISVSDLYQWQGYTLTVNLPANTSVKVDILDENNVPLSGLSNLVLVDGSNFIDLTSVNVNQYNALRLRAYLLTDMPGTSPELLGWQLGWETSSALTYRIVGQVFDGHRLWMPSVRVTLFENGIPLVESAADEYGRYTFNGLLPEENDTYQVRVSLEQGMPLSPTFQVRYAFTSTYAGPVVYLQTPPLSFDLDSAFTTQEVNFDFLFDQEEYETNISDFPERLDDAAAIYNHTHQAVSFINEALTTTLRPLDINIYATTTSRAFYDDEASAVVIGAAYSNYENGNRPMNREWHEVFHALMADTISIPDPDCVPSGNHGGYNNCSTTDSWVEGYAEFWTLMLSDYLEIPKPYLYHLGNYGAVSLEMNWEAWSLSCEEEWCSSREDFALAALLWDLYDDANEPPTNTIPVGDNLTLSRDEIWTILGDPDSPTPLVDVKALYDALSEAGVGQTDSLADDCPEFDLNDLDDLFVLHGFFHDINDNQKFDCLVAEYEGIGRAADGSRPGRRATPPIEAFVSLDVIFSEQFEPAQISQSEPIILNIDFTVADQPSLSFSYTNTLTSMNGNQVFLEPFPYNPTHDNIVTTTLWIQANGSITTNPLSFTNQQYGEWLEELSDPSVSVLTHTFELIPAADITFSPPQSSQARPSSLVTHTFTLTNSGNIDDIITITPTSSLSWEVFVEPLVIPLESGESTSVTVITSVPANTQPGTVNETNLLAASKSNIAVTASTSSIIEVIPSSYQLYLPKIFRN